MTTVHYSPNKYRNLQNGECQQCTVHCTGASTVARLPSFRLPTSLWPGEAWCPTAESPEPQKHASLLMKRPPRWLVARYSRGCQSAPRYDSCEWRGWQGHWIRGGLRGVAAMYKGSRIVNTCHSSTGVARTVRGQIADTGSTTA